jgi:hypothetical protein
VRWIVEGPEGHGSLLSFCANKLEDAELKDKKNSSSWIDEFLKKMGARATKGS